MSFRSRWVLALAVAGILMPPAAFAGDSAAAATSDAPCGAPASELENPFPLAHVHAAIRERRRLTAVALGSSSTAGTAASGPTAAWPARLETHLTKGLKGVAVTVANAGLPRQTAAQMVERIAKDVLSRAPDLVVWEVGTAEAMRGTDPEAFEQVLLQGLDQLAKGGSDVLLMNMQFSPPTSKVINFYPYLEIMESAAAMRSLWVFDRYAIMQHWVEGGRFSFEDKPLAQQRQLADQVYDCLGQILAEVIFRSAK